MARAVVNYDKDLPEIPDRLPYLPPDSFLRKKAGTDEFEIVEGRRPSKLLLVNKLRQAIGAWRNEGYPDIYHSGPLYLYKENLLVSESR